MRMPSGRWVALERRSRVGWTSLKTWPSPPAPNSQQQPQKAEESLEKTRTRVIQDMGYLAQGGQLTTAGVTSSGVLLRMQFARPVVIGYSAIRFGLFPDLPPAQAESAHSAQ